MSKEKKYYIIVDKEGEMFSMHRSMILYHTKKAARDHCDLLNQNFETPEYSVKKFSLIKA